MVLQGQKRKSSDAEKGPYNPQIACVRHVNWAVIIIQKVDIKEQAEEQAGQLSPDHSEQLSLQLRIMVVVIMTDLVLGMKTIACYEW